MDVEPVVPGYWEAFVNGDNPIVVYGNVSISGINTSEDDWVNDSNSNRDLGIFIKPGETVKKGSQRSKMEQLAKLKSILLFGTEKYNKLDSFTRNLFTKDAFDSKNLRYFVRVEAESNYNKLVGLTEKSGLKNEDRILENNKVVTIVVQIKGNDGKIYEVTLGGLNSPKKYSDNKAGIKKSIQKRIDELSSTSDNTEEDKKELNKLINRRNHLNGIIQDYSNKIAHWTTQDQLFELKNPPSFSHYVYLQELDKYYRLEELRGNKHPYYEAEPVHQVDSAPYIIVRAEDLGLNRSLNGRSVMFMTSNPLLHSKDLMDRYIHNL